MKKLIGTVAVVLAGILIFQQLTPTEPAREDISTNNTSTPTGNLTDIIDQKQATLQAVGKYRGNGSATTSWNGKNFTHELIANLNEPAEGKFYEGWLVKKSPSLTFFSTGKLQQETDGTYSLIYKSSQNSPEHLEIVVTEETSANGLDNKPETHVLEGMLQK